MTPQGPEDTLELKPGSHGPEPQRGCGGGMGVGGAKGFSYFTSLCLGSLVCKLIIMCLLFHLQKEEAVLC